MAFKFCLSLFVASFIPFLICFAISDFFSGKDYRREEKFLRIAAILIIPAAIGIVGVIISCIWR